MPQAQRPAPMPQAQRPAPRPPVTAENSSSSAAALSAGDLAALNNIPTPGAGSTASAPSSSSNTPRVPSQPTGALSTDDLSALNSIPTPGSATSSSSSTPGLSPGDLSALNSIPTPGATSGVGHNALSGSDLDALNSIPTPKAGGSAALSKSDLDLLNAIPTPKAKPPEPAAEPINKPEPVKPDFLAKKDAGARPSQAMRGRAEGADEPRGSAGRGAPSARARGFEQGPEIPWGFIGILASVLFVLAIGAYVVWRAINTPPEPDATPQSHPALTQPAPAKPAIKAPPAKKPVAKPAKGK